MASAAKTTLNPGSGGQSVRTLEVTVLQGDGTTATVEMQVVSIADPNGKVLSFDGIEGQLEQLNTNIEELLFEIRLQNETSEE